jgi:hypothetical protein
MIRWTTVTVVTVVVVTMVLMLMLLPTTNGHSFTSDDAVDATR